MVKKIYFPLTALLLAINLISCGHLTQDFPLTLTYTNTSAAQQVEIDAAIDELNQALGIVVITKKVTNSVLTIKVVDYIGETDIADTYVAGQADTKSDRCDVQINSRVMSTSTAKTIIWHEIGHCAGLGHVSGVEQIMYKIAYSFDEYSAEAIASFLTDFKTSTGIK